MAKPGHVAAQPFHDLQPLPDRCAEMPGPGDRIAMEEVIRPNLDAQQSPHQLAHGLQVVVDPLEQHRVVVERHAGTQQTAAHAGHLRRDLARMVEVRLNPHLLRPGQDVEQLLIVELLRQGGRHARADADHVHVRNVAQVFAERNEACCTATSADRRRRR